MYNYPPHFVYFCTTTSVLTSRSIHPHFWARVPYSRPPPDTKVPACALCCLGPDCRLCSVSGLWFSGLWVSGLWFGRCGVFHWSPIDHPDSDGGVRLTSAASVILRNIFDWKRVNTQWISRQLTHKSTTENPQKGADKLWTAACPLNRPLVTNTERNSNAVGDKYKCWEGTNTWQIYCKSAAAQIWGLRTINHPLRIIWTRKRWNILSQKLQQ